MAEVEEVIAARLLAHTGVAALVGTRVRPVRRDQDDTLPCITYRRVTADYVESIGGTTDLAHPILEITAYGATYASVRAVARQVFEALERWSSASSSPVVQDTLPVEGAWDEDFDGDTDWYVTQQFEVWYTEA